MIRSISMPLSVRCLSKPAARRSSNQQLRPSVQNQPWVRLADASETILVFVIAFGQIAPPQPGQRITQPLNLRWRTSMRARMSRVLKPCTRAP